MKPNKIYILHDIGKTELTPEEAKEHLSDTELPPNMKKIIEGVGKMSRIEDIKDRFNKGHYIVVHESHHGTPFHDREPEDDIEYLLSRLEIAEKALMDVAGYNGKFPDGYECGIIAKQALEQIDE